MIYGILVSMKTLLISLFFAGIVFTPLSVGAQQLSSDAATGSDIQAQSTSGYLQQQQPSQQTSSVTTNAGSTYLNTPTDQEIKVADDGTTPTTNAETTTSQGFNYWIIGLGIIAAVLVAPLFYIYKASMQSSDEEVAVAQTPKQAKKVSDEPVLSAKEQKLKASAAKAKTTPSKSKAKKKPASKAKRGKKKK